MSAECRPAGPKGGPAGSTAARYACRPCGPRRAPSYAHAHQSSHKVHRALNAAPNTRLPVSQIVPWGDADAISLLQRQMGADILVTGNTHKFEVGGPQRGWADGRVGATDGNSHGDNWLRAWIWHGASGSGPAGGLHS